MPPDSSAALTDRPPRTDGLVVVLKLGAYPQAVRTARRFVHDMLSGLVPDGHLDAVELCTSELVTNARAAATFYAELMQFGWSYRDTPIHLGVLARERWTRLDVRDPYPEMLPPPKHGLLEEHGRGLQLVDEFAVRRWPVIARDHKTMHAVIPVDGALTKAELVAALPERRPGR